MNPQIYILHGDDTFSMARAVDGWYEAMGDPTTADLNFSRLDGRTTSDNDLRTATDAMPFLASHRLVVLTSPLARLTGEAARVRFLAHLDRLSPTTVLVLVIEDHQRRRGEWETLKPAHWLLQWAGKNPEKAKVMPFALPDPGSMPSWIMKEAGRQVEALEQEKKVKFNARFALPAANELFKHVGCDTQVAAQEIGKLLTYVSYRRVVEPEDVVELVAQTGQADVFALVDALGARNGSIAVRQAQVLLEKQDALSLMGMVIRQFRLLLLAREVIAEGGGPNQIVDRLRGEPYRVSSRFVADKLFAQARPFSLPQLEDIYRRLLEVDETIKTGQMDSNLALMTFIVELAK